MGAGATTIYSRPDQYTFGGIFSFGMDRKPPWAHAYYLMNQVRQGDAKATLKTPSDSRHFAVGDNVFLFYGAFQANCPAVNGQPGANCQFDELNSITSIDRLNGVLHFKYPTTLTFRNDGTNPFGILDLNSQTQSYHHIVIHDINFDVESPIMLPRLVFDGQFYNLTAPSGMNAGWQYIGLNRQFNFHDNRFVIGDGGGAFHTMEELDHADDYTFKNNVFIWNVAPGVAGSYVNYGIVLTEGTGGNLFLHNKFVNGIVGAECNANDWSFIGNDMINSMIASGRLVADGCNVASFGTQNSHLISDNRFYGAPAPAAAAIEERNVVQNERILNNTIILNPSDVASACIKASSGSIAGNSCYMNGTKDLQSGSISTHRALIPSAPQCSLYKLSETTFTP